MTITQKSRGSSLVIAILAIIGGAEGWEDIENYGIAKQEWLSEFLELPYGIPSDDTFRWLFERINPAWFKSRLQNKKPLVT